MSTERANLPLAGEQLVFEDGDLREFTGSQTTIRVLGIKPAGMGQIRIDGVVIGSQGLPVLQVDITVPVVTVEARRVHRRLR